MFANHLVVSMGPENGKGGEGGVFAWAEKDSEERSRDGIVFGWKNGKRLEVRNTSCSNEVLGEDAGGPGGKKGF